MDCDKRQASHIWTILYEHFSVHINIAKLSSLHMASVRACLCTPMFVDPLVRTNRKTQTWRSCRPDLRPRTFSQQYFHTGVPMVPPFRACPLFCLYPSPSSLFPPGWQRHRLAPRPSWEAPAMLRPSNPFPLDVEDGCPSHLCHLSPVSSSFAWLPCQGISNKSEICVSGVNFPCEA